MISKVAFLFATLVAVQATGLLHGVALVHTGASASSRSQDAHGNYAFGYDIVDGKGASNSRSEVGDAHGNKKGSYTLHDIDGRARRVDYVADAHGFRAAVKTNEPGTALSAPAAALVASPYAGPVAPVADHVAVAPAVAPVVVAPHAATVVSHVAPAPIALAGHGLAYNSVVNTHGLGLLAPYGLGYNGLAYGKGLGHGLLHTVY
ncbi:adult-specific rigid cuticular protein 15.7-like [Uloborus diversus]|uniref:adult-specific rigid cuticular protein 15.7-like n=1 Tax=Uloborus diversus TaxID=327109 RepID=UPI002409761E|nr:adult-specific rigid cuticular protein 15.7-like [Uloborus diversus]